MEDEEPKTFKWAGDAVAKDQKWLRKKPQPALA